MVRIFAFNFLFLLCVGYALLRGRRPERTVALIFCIARIGTDVMLLLAGGFYRGPEYGGFVIDGVTFIGLMWVALTADRFWPMPVAAMQGVSLLAHFGRMAAYDILQNTYLNAVQLWAYPQLLLLLVGTMRVDLRARRSLAGWWPLNRDDIA